MTVLSDANATIAKAKLPTAKPPAASALLNTFYRAVLPEAGSFCLFLLPEARHVWADSIDDLVELTNTYQDRAGVYFGTSAFKTTGNRKGTNVLGLRSLRLDIDAGPEKLAKHGIDAVYATQADALADSVRFFKTTGLVPSYVISSGAGLHIYFCLDQDLTPEQWLPLAKALSFKGAISEFKIDVSVTEDTARILRPVGTLHHDEVRVKILKATGKVYTVDELSNLLGALPPARKYDTSVNKDLIFEDEAPTASAFKIAEQCGALRQVVDAGGDVPEPYWRAMLGLVKHTIEADDAAHEWSQGYDGYDAEATTRKLASWATGPTTCAEFGKHSKACSSCPHRSKIKSPIMLGHPSAATKADTGEAAMAQSIESGALRPIVDQDGQLNYVETFVKDGRTCRNVVRAGTVEGNDLIITTVSGAKGKAPSQQTITTAEARLRTNAKRSGEVTQVNIRTAQRGYDRYHDLGPGRVAKITPEGVHVIDESGDVPLFRRGTGAGELPNPVPFEAGADQALRKVLSHYKDILGVPTEEAIFHTALLLDRLDPATTHPIGEYVGPPGCGKSTAAEHDIAVIDPPSKPGLRTTGTKVEDLAASAQQQYILCIDNASRIDKTTSDVLCQASTGGTLTARRLYSQNETIALHLLRPVTITAVNHVCREADLQTRTERFEFSPRPGGNVIGEEEMRVKIAAALPVFLGALYALKVASLRILPQVIQRGGWHHRLVTFDQCGEAMLTSAGHPPGFFQKLVAKRRESRARRTATGDMFLIALHKALKVADGRYRVDHEPSLRQVLQRSPVAAVFESVNGMAALMRPSVLLGLMPRTDPWEKHSAIPASERALLDALRRVQPLLIAIGIGYRELEYGSRSLVRFDWSKGVMDDE